ncbi:MAG TPA: RNA polymerase sigma factor [Phenylobacterium sp.]|uniref:RNA polymerase sigma factor n=1 Tax=Phenylobacterium sp. TaxID=1871053 RepID=UPI002F93F9E9
MPRDFAGWARREALGDVVKSSRNPTKGRLLPKEMALHDPIAWIAERIVPHEPDVRRWLRRSTLGGFDPDDAIQEAYARIAAASNLAAVREPRAYFFTVVRNVILEQMRRARITPIAVVADLQSSFVVDEGADPERIAAGRDELRQVFGMIQRLPQKLRQVLLMRRVEGLPQKEIARRLGVPESTVEKRSAKALRLLLADLRSAEDGLAPTRALRRREWR